MIARVDVFLSPMVLTVYLLLVLCCVCVFLALEQRVLRRYPSIRRRYCRFRVLVTDEFSVPTLSNLWVAFMLPLMIILLTDHWLLQGHLSNHVLESPLIWITYVLTIFLTFMPSRNLQRLERELRYLHQRYPDSQETHGLIQRVKQGDVLAIGRLLDASTTSTKDS